MEIREYIKNILLLINPHKGYLKDDIIKQLAVIDSLSRLIDEELAQLEA